MSMEQGRVTRGDCDIENSELRPLMDKAMPWFLMYRDHGLGSQYQGSCREKNGREQVAHDTDSAFEWVDCRLTSALSGPRDAVAARRRRKISPRARGAPPASFHGLLQRLVRRQSELGLCM
jgi:hypothetical protein